MAATDSSDGLATPIKAVIFDMDGLLLDSERLYTQVTNEILAPYNKQLTWEIKAMLMGRPSEESAKILIERTGIPLSPNELLSMFATRQRTLFATVQPMPGAVKLIQHLHKCKIPMAIATGSNSTNYKLKSENLSELFSAFEGKVVCGDDEELKRGKPHPDPFLLAASRHLGMKLEKCDPATGFLEPPSSSTGQTEEGLESTLRADQILVFEDGLAGVQAAKAAGMKVVWVPDPELKNLLNRQNNQQSDIVADQVLESLLQWNGADWNLPPF
ncbi:hypothetical protein MJO28_003458 [Puccinia striiformis f. sp. tritici]|uniref:Uncharacterized protein n=1 Tax=Puccinia striiformis f. sp. tritici TaxID=168172 RepID=A0ACC0EST1_9BASI|nr:hypothetical protein Pst134EA_004634 [Puccinia striiformis f. sp. tritici]KAH9470712.1 hypothetical protein Pst134EA_004634 [Puccinia striiformis f. sp. tritici]KAI7959667.1 hypothetical protein MJO28_003458 [Puccinia striiformis f. sp. tritici]KAI9623010.1 hypothetical protein KEM48_009625 [Puccinia striiformis f. sp. tritici PST-130]